MTHDLNDPNDRRDQMLVSKCPNGKLHVEGRGYVSLEYVAEVVRNGSPIEVISHLGDDVTAEILARAIVSESSKGKKFDPNPLEVSIRTSSSSEASPGPIAPARKRPGLDGRNILGPAKLAEVRKRIEEGTATKADALALLDHLDFVSDFAVRLSNDLTKDKTR